MTQFPTVGARVRYSGLAYTVAKTGTGFATGTRFALLAEIDQWVPVKDLEVIENQTE